MSKVRARESAATMSAVPMARSKVVMMLRITVFMGTRSELDLYTFLYCNSRTRSQRSSDEDCEVKVWQAECPK